MEIKIVSKNSQENHLHMAIELVNLSVGLITFHLIDKPLWLTFVILKIYK